ncbi:MAG: CBS domain-containing protein [Candidatus Binatia bacterium]|nr:CBS domain-containing protein [Candidatus Binatia bacterium]
MLVRDLMQTEVVTLNARDHLDLADSLMRLGRIRHMPVVEDGKLVGILSQRDLFRAGISTVLHLRPSAEREWLAKIPVREVMTAPVITATPNMPVRQAVNLLLEHKIGCLPVVDRGELVGLVSETDFLRYLARLLDLWDTKQDLPGLEEPE